MRLFLFLLLAPCAFAQMATYTQGCVNSNADANVTCVITVTSGHLYVASSKTQATTTATPGFASSGVSCTWQQAVAPIQHDTVFTSTMYSCIPVASGSMTITASWTGGAAAFTDIAVGDYSADGTWVSTPLDQAASSDNNAEATTTALTGTTSATSNAHDLVVAVSNNFNVGQTWGALSGWTNEATSSRNTVGWYDQNVTTTGAQSASIPLSGADTSTGMIAAFKMQAASAPVPTAPARFM